MPHLALPSLAAYLRTNGVEVTLDDLNAEVFDRRLLTDGLQLASAPHFPSELRLSGYHLTFIAFCMPVDFRRQKSCPW